MKGARQAGHASRKIGHFKEGYPRSWSALVARKHIEELLAK